MKKEMKLRITGILLVALVFGVASFLAACYPGDPLTTTDTDVVTTLFRQGADFSTKMTYAQPSTVIKIKGDGTVDITPPANNATIISRINANMQALGYTVADSTTADVIVAAAVTETEWVGGGCYPGYWGWYGYPGWGWCYPYAYTYTTGTLLIVMWDRNQASNNEALWVAAMNGLIQGTVSSTRINNAINQAFAQSPYLGDGK